MKVNPSNQPSASVLRQRRSLSRKAFTLPEVMVAMAVTAMSLGGVIAGYIFATRQAEWSAYSLAAQSLAAQRLEQTRAAKWDPRGGEDELVLTNFPTISTNILDMPVSGTNIAYATNFTGITDVSGGSGYPLRMIRVDCVWSFRERTYSNSVFTCRAPDQ